MYPTILPLSIMELSIRSSMRFMLALRHVFMILNWIETLIGISKVRYTTVEFSGGVRVTDKERTIADSIKDLNLIAGLEEVISCVVSVNSIDETKMLTYLAGYDSAFLYQKTGFILSEYQKELGVSDAFIKICKDRSGNSKRYLTNGISEPGYSGEWKLVYPKNIKQMKNGEIENATI